jgi:hypothetical protein
VNAQPLHAQPSSSCRRAAGAGAGSLRSAGASQVYVTFPVNPSEQENTMCDSQGCRSAWRPVPAGTSSVFSGAATPVPSHVIGKHRSLVLNSPPCSHV